MSISNNLLPSLFHYLSQGSCFDLLCFHELLPQQQQELLLDDQVGTMTLCPTPHTSNNAGHLEHTISHVRAITREMNELWQATHVPGS